MDGTVREPHDEITPVPRQTKEEAFKENPDRFEDLEGVLMVVKRDQETGRLMVLNQCRSVEECWVVQGITNRSLDTLVSAFEARAAAAKQIITPTVKHNGRGMFGFKK